MKDETFFLDTDDGSKECTVITTMYSESRKKYYVIYEYTDNENEDVFVSSYEPTDENGVLQDITDELELKEIESFLNEYGDEE